MDCYGTLRMIGELTVVFLGAGESIGGGPVHQEDPDQARRVREGIRAPEQGAPAAAGHRPGVQRCRAVDAVAAPRAPDAAGPRAGAAAGPRPRVRRGARPPRPPARVQAARPRAAAHAAAGARRRAALPPAGARRRADARPPTAPAPSRQSPHEPLQAPATTGPSDRAPRRPAKCKFCV